ncbi:NADPH2:quinone reductase [Isoptericola variabilis J7]|nr:NADPH2:quinone reductase [Isoptericola variabilis J7]
MEAVGPGVDGPRAGDRVWADLFEHGHGALADRVRVPASALSPVPDGVTLADAATVPHSGGLALQGLRAAGLIRPGSGCS